MKRISSFNVFLISLVLVSLASAQNASGIPPKEEPALPYIPSLDVSAMDKSIDPCVDLYHYSCGGWQKKNPIPPDQTSWSVYGKLYQDNLTFLRGILEQSGPSTPQRDAVTQKIGDFYASCMDENTADKRGAAAIQSQLDAIAGLRSVRDMASLIAHVSLPFGRTLLFAAGSTQDPDNSEQEIADLDQGGLGLPDRDYYTKDDAKSKEIRQRYLQHVEKIFEMLGDNRDSCEAACGNRSAHGDGVGQGVLDSGGAARSLQAEEQNEARGSRSVGAKLRLADLLSPAAIPEV